MECRLQNVLRIAEAALHYFLIKQIKSSSHLYCVSLGAIMQEASLKNYPLGFLDLHC
jgi:hypothetical protein